MVVDYEDSWNVFIAGRHVGHAARDAIGAALDYVPLGMNGGAYRHNEGAIRTGASTKHPNLPNLHRLYP